MTQPRWNVDDSARAFLTVLRCAQESTNVHPYVYVTGAIEMLGGLHSVTEDGGLPQVVDGQDFRAEAARLFDLLRRPTRIAVTNLCGSVEDARSHELYIALEQRSAVQFLVDDFRGTVADRLVEDDLFDDVDIGFARKLREHGPFDFTVPRKTPASHWWWASATGRG